MLMADNTVGSGGRTAGSGAGTVTVTPCRPDWPHAVHRRTLPGGCLVRILWLASAGQVGPCAAELGLRPEVISLRLRCCSSRVAYRTLPGS